MFSLKKNLVKVGDKVCVNNKETVIEDIEMFKGEISRVKVNGEYRKLEDVDHISKLYSEAYFSNIFKTRHSCNTYFFEMKISVVGKLSIDITNGRVIFNNYDNVDDYLSAELMSDLVLLQSWYWNQKKEIKLSDYGSILSELYDGVSSADYIRRSVLYPSLLDCVKVELNVSNVLLTDGFVKELFKDIYITFNSNMVKETLSITHDDRDIGYHTAKNSIEKFLNSIDEGNDCYE